MKKESTELYIQSADKIEEAVILFFESYIAPAGIRRLGLAVSGGPDSMALFHLLLPICRQKEITPVVMHLNHGLRDESPEEAAFVKELARRKRVPFVSKTLDLRNRQKGNRSLEMEAREERLLFYAECVGDHELDAIATGHHADDLCETLLLRLARGSGIAGLAGMKPVSSVRTGGESSIDLTVFRPFLNVSCGALREWLRKRDLQWHDDLSNLDTTIQRNNIRHCIMPFLREKLSADVDARLCHSAAILREDEAFLNDIAEKKLASVKYNGAILTAALQQLPLAIRRRVLRLWLFDHDLADVAGLRTVDDLLIHCEADGGNRTVQLARDVLAYFEGELLRIYNPSKNEILPDFELVPDETILWGGFDIKIVRSKGIRASSDGVAVYPASCSLDAGRLKGKTLIVRQRREGDRIRPTGMQGSKKVKDILIDAKVPRYERDTIPVIAIEDEVLWVPGYRISRDYAVGSDTADAIHISVTRS